MRKLVFGAVAAAALSSAVPAFANGSCIGMNARGSSPGFVGFVAQVFGGQFLVELLGPQNCEF